MSVAACLFRVRFCSGKSNDMQVYRRTSVFEAGTMDCRAPTCSQFHHVHIFTDAIAPPPDRAWPLFFLFGSVQHVFLLCKFCAARLFFPCGLVQVQPSPATHAILRLRKAYIFRVALPWGCGDLRLFFSSLRGLSVLLGFPPLLPYGLD